MTSRDGVHRSVRIAGPDPRSVAARDGAGYRGAPVTGTGSSRERLLQVLATGVAHQVRNPLTAILGYVELARRIDDAGDGWLQGIRREVDRIDRVVEGLEELAGRDRRLPGSTDLNELARRVVRRLREDGRLENARVEVEPTRGLPELPWDGTSIERVVERLLVNADDAVGGRQDPGAGRVVVATRRATEFRVAVSVLDDGPGIPAEDPGLIFEPFYTTKPDGMGLGLAVARRVVEDLGGTLVAQNRCDSGARFTVILPIVGPRTGPEHVETPAERKLAASSEEDRR